MVWSVLLYEREILEQIKANMSIDKTISVNKLHLIFMRLTKATRPNTIANGIRVFESFGFIKLRDDQWFDVDLDRIDIRLIQLQTQAK